MRYVVLTPIKIAGRIHRDGHVELDEAIGDALCAQGVVSKDPNNPAPSAPKSPATSGAAGKGEQVKPAPSVAHAAAGAPGGVSAEQIPSGTDSAVGSSSKDETHDGHGGGGSAAPSGQEAPAAPVAVKAPAKKAAAKTAKAATK